jgi:hypothetical protein
MKIAKARSETASQMLERITPNEIPGETIIHPKVTTIQKYNQTAMNS